MAQRSRRGDAQEGMKGYKRLLSGYFEVLEGVVERGWRSGRE